MSDPELAAAVDQYLTSKRAEQPVFCGQTHQARQAILQDMITLYSNLSPYILSLSHLLWKWASQAFDTPYAKAVWIKDVHGVPMLKDDTVSAIHPALQSYIAIPFQTQDQPPIVLSGWYMAFTLWMQVNPDLATLFIQCALEFRCPTYGEITALDGEDAIECDGKGLYRVVRSDGSAHHFTAAGPAGIQHRAWSHVLQKYTLGDDFAFQLEQDQKSPDFILNAKVLANFSKLDGFSQTSITTQHAIINAIEVFSNLLLCEPIPIILRKTYLPWTQLEGLSLEKNYELVWFEGFEFIRRLGERVLIPHPSDSETSSTTRDYWTRFGDLFFPNQQRNWMWPKSEDEDKSNSTAAANIVKKTLAKAQYLNRLRLHRLVLSSEIRSPPSSLLLTPGRDVGTNMEKSTSSGSSDSDDG